MADSFWFWSNITDISSIIDDDQNIRGGGRRSGYTEGRQEQEMNMMSRSMMKFDEQNYTGIGGRRYNEGGQEQETMMMRSMIRLEDDHHQNNTATKKTKANKKGGGRTCQKKPEKKTPKRGVGIAKLEETIKQKNSLLAVGAADRQVYHRYPTTAVAEVIPTTTYNHSPPFHHPFLNRQQQKQTSTISSLSVVPGDANTQRIFDGGQLDLNHVPSTNIHKNQGYDQVMKYGSSSTATNVSNGGPNDQLMFKSHAPQTYLLHHQQQQQQQHGNNEARYYNPNPNAGSGTDRQHGNNNVAGYNSRPEVAELSSTPKQQHYCLSQHSDHIWLNNQKNLNNGENIGGFTRLNNKTDFPESDLGRNWNNNYNNVNGRQLKKEFTSSSSIAATPGLVPTTGYSGVTTKGKSSLSSSSSSNFYEFLSLTTGGIKGHHTAARGGYKKADYYDHHYSSNYSSSSCIMEESGAACSSVRNGAAQDNISSSSQSNTRTHDHEFLDLSLKLSSYH